MRVVRLLSAALLGFGGLAGCQLGVPIADPPDVDGTFYGLESEIDAAATTDGTLRLLFVHGMGRHRPGYANPLLRKLAEGLGMEEVPRADEEPEPKPGESVLRRRSWTGGAENPRRRLETYEITWSPVVEGIKDAALGFDNSPEFRNRRHWLNAELKQDFINDRFADPVIYLGRHGPKVRAAVQGGILQLLKDDDPLKDRVAAITMSLGSAVFLDALFEASDPAFESSPLYLGNRIQDFDERVAAYERRRHPVYLLANQLPLLDLGGDGAEPPPPPRADGERPVRWKIDLVAIGDPNDLLTYALTDAFMDGYRNAHPQVELTHANAFVHVEPTALLGIVVNPITAHVGHERNPRVIDLLLGGSAARNGRTAAPSGARISP